MDKPFTIDAYPRYSRWSDDNNRLHVILEKRGTPEMEGGHLTLTDCKIFLLDVHAEKVNEIKQEDFDRYVRTNLLRQLSNNLKT